MTVFFRYWVAPKLGGGPKTDDGQRAGGPLRMRLAFEELGGAWVKLGQMLAMRFDLLPAAYGDEMFKLSTRCGLSPIRRCRKSSRGNWRATRRGLPSRSSRVVRGRVDRPGASGGPQSGEAVAVKVQRPVFEPASGRHQPDVCVCLGHGPESDLRRDAHASGDR
jgi:hypothetical protein